MPTAQVGFVLFTLLITVFAVMTQLHPLMVLAERVANRPALGLRPLNCPSLAAAFVWPACYLIAVFVLLACQNLGARWAGFTTFSLGLVQTAVIMLVLAGCLAAVAAWQRGSSVTVASGVIATLGAMVLVHAARLQVAGAHQVSLGLFFDRVVILLVLAMLAAAALRRRRTVVLATRVITTAVVVGAVLMIIGPQVPGWVRFILWLVALAGLAAAVALIALSSAVVVPLGPATAGAAVPRASSARGRAVLGLLAVLVIVIGIFAYGAYHSDGATNTRNGVTAGGASSGGSSSSGPALPASLTPTQAAASCARLSPDGTTLSGTFIPSTRTCSNEPARLQPAAASDYSLTDGTAAPGINKHAFGVPVCTYVSGRQMTTEWGSQCARELMAAVSHDTVLASVVALRFGLVPGVTLGMTSEQIASQRDALFNQLQDAGFRRSFTTQLWGAIAAGNDPIVEPTSGGYYRAYRDRQGRVWQEMPTLDDGKNFALALASPSGNVLFSLENGFAPLDQSKQMPGIPVRVTDVSNTAYEAPPPAVPTVATVVWHPAGSSRPLAAPASPVASHSPSALPSSGVSDPQGPRVIQGTTAIAGPLPTPASADSSAPVPSGGSTGTPPDSTPSPVPTGTPPPPAG